MKKTTLSIAATGDSLMVDRFPESYGPDLAAIRDYLSSADVRITNLETNVGPFGEFASAYSGGTWLNTEPEAFESMLGYGFNYFGTANNHSMDYAYGGLLSTIRNLKAHGLAFSGTGKSLAEAGKPALVKTPAGKIGVIAVTTTFDNASRAGRPSLGSAARPGVNYVRSTRYFAISPKDMELLGEVADRCGVNAYHKLMIAEGFEKPEEKGVFAFGKTLFCSDGSKPASECNKADLKRVTDSIRTALKTCSQVFVLIHCHEIDGVEQCDVPAFLEELAHACVEAGASAIFGGGAHELRPMEIYRGAPIFYSLGDFIYQGMLVKYLPADFMEKYGMPDNATALEGLMTRSKGGKIGLQAQEANFLTVIPKMTFKDGRLKSLELLPVDLAFSRKDVRKGLPRVATGKMAREICNRLSRLSAPYGTRLQLKNGRIYPQF